MSLREFSFPDCCKILLVIPVATAKNYCPVNLLSVVSKVFKKLVNNSLVDHLEKLAFFLISSMVLGLLNQL